MTAVVEILASPELVVLHPSLAVTLQLLNDRLNALPPEDIVAMLKGVSHALATAEEAVPAAVTALMGGRNYSVADRVEAAIDVLARSFARRRELLADALTAIQVARLLDSPHQTLEERIESGTLLAAMADGELRFPIWQFDPSGDEGVVTGLPAVVRALEVSPIAKLSWLTLANSMLDGETPLACLKAGEIERVLGLARAVGVT